MCIVESETMTDRTLKTL